MSEEYIKDISRLGCSFFDICVWYEGESDELKKVLGFGFFNTFFVVEEKNVTSYYNDEECTNFYLILDKKLTEEFFNETVERFFGLIEESKKAETKEEIFNLMVKFWPALAIFHEISNCPEYANEKMLERLFKIRKATESLNYHLSKKINFIENVPEKYIFFKGKIINLSFDEFCKENNFIVKNG